MLKIKRMSVEAEIRDAIRTSGTTVTKLARLSAVNRQSLRRFLDGGGLSLPNLEAIAQACGLRLSVEPIADMRKE